MTTLEVKLNLPDSLVKEARQAGLLAPRELERLLREAVRQRRVNRLFEAREKLQAADIAPMTDEEIEEEIRMAREEARRAPGS